MNRIVICLSAAGILLLSCSALATPGNRIRREGSPRVDYTLSPPESQRAMEVAGRYFRARKILRGPNVFYGRVISCDDIDVGGDGRVDMVLCHGTVPVSESSEANKSVYCNYWRVDIDYCTE